MFRSHPHAAPLLVAIGDFVAMFAAWLLALRSGAPPFSPMLLLLLTLLHQLVLSGNSLHTQLRYLGAGELLRRVVAAWLRIALAIALLGFLVPQRVPREFAMVFGILFLGTLLLVRFGSRWLRRWIRQRGRNLRFLLIAGTGRSAAAAAEHFAGDTGLGLRVVGHLRGDGADPPSVSADRILGSHADIERVARDHVIDELVIADPDLPMTAMSRLVEAGHTLGLRTHVVADFLPGTWRGVAAHHVQGDIVLSLSPYPHDVFGLTIKRTLDLIGAVLGSLLLLPLVVVIAIAIKLDAPGPVFFTQWRVGLNGRRFRFPKFRSMHVDAEARLAELRAQNEMDGPVFKMRSDPRVTRVGRWLRRFSLDELPQLWCVLKGDMSLVGPRPLMVHEVDGHDTWQRRRMSMRPGLTCLWQVSGRNDIDFERWMRLDLQYIDTWSLGLDLRILARTVPAVLSGRGAS